MGSAQSTRRITIDNDSDPSSVINVSEKVVDRLNGKKVAGDRSPPVSEDEEPNDEIQKEMSKNDEYWQKRIAALKVSQAEMDNKMQKEFARTVQEMDKLLPRPLPQDGKLPCQDKKSLVVSCYKKNPKQPLLCAKEVAEFSNCMNNTRIGLQQQGKLC